MLVLQVQGGSAKGVPDLRACKERRRRMEGNKKDLEIPSMLYLLLAQKGKQKEFLISVCSTFSRFEMSAHD